MGLKSKNSIEITINSSSDLSPNFLVRFWGHRPFSAHFHAAKWAKIRKYLGFFHAKIWLLLLRGQFKTILIFQDAKNDSKFLSLNIKTVKYPKKRQWLGNSEWKNLRNNCIIYFKHVRKWILRYFTLRYFTLLDVSSFL